MFWIRFDRLYNQLRGMSIDWPPRLLYMKAYYALEISPEQRMMVTTAMESRNSIGMLGELRRITVKYSTFQSRKLTKNCPTRQEKMTTKVVRPSMTTMI